MQLFEESWLVASNDAVSPKDAFFKGLCANPIWRTIVNEEIQSRLSWSSMLTPESYGKKLFEWIISWIEKIFSKQHPVTRTAGTVIVALLSLWGVKSIKPDLVTIPITASVVSPGQPLRVSFIPNAPGTSIPVSFSLSTDTKTLPITFNLDAATKPIQLKFVHSDEMLNNIGDQLKATNISLREATSNLKLIANGSPKSDLQDVNRTLTAISSNLSSASSQLGDVHSTLSKLTLNYEDTQKKLLESSQKGTNTIHQELGVLSRVASGSLAPISVLVNENSSHAIVLPAFDALSGKTFSPVVELFVGKIDTSKKGGSVILKASSQENPLLLETGRLEKGKAVKLQKLNWNLTVTDVQSHWFGKRAVQLTFSPEADPIQIVESGCNTCSGVQITSCTTCSSAH
jgi:hypothetical protein